MEHIRHRPFEPALLQHLDANYNLANWLPGNERDAENLMQDACVHPFKFFSGFLDGGPRVSTVGQR